MHELQLPLPLRAINRVGAYSRKVGLGGVSLAPDTLIAKATRKTGLSDFGRGPYREGLDVLCQALEQEAALSTWGRIMAQQMLITCLSNQLQMEDWFKRYPEIGDEAVEAPVMIIGMPRTGTTILHELMQQDPNNRIPLFWEVAYPFPPPQTATYRNDPRIAKNRRDLSLMHYIMPEVRNMHRMGEQLPQECVAMTSNMFTSMLFITIFRVPSYARWLFTQADNAEMYRYHRRFLQYLQWRCPGHWVVKTPAYLWTLDALLAEYPDARLIQTHRDPLRIVSSLTSMFHVMRKAYSDEADYRALGQEWADYCTMGLDKSLLTRQSGIIKPEQVIDIQFRDFVADPAGNVKKIYTFFGMEFSDQLAADIQRYIEDNPSDKHGGHQYTFEDTGLDYQRERGRAQAYQDYFGVKSEF